MRRTAPRNPPSLRSRSGPTHAGSSVPAGAGAVDLRVLAPGSVGASGAAAVRQHALRDQRVGVLPVRALWLLPPAQQGWGVAVRPGAADLARDAGRQCAPLRAAVRAAGRCDPRAPEQSRLCAMPTRPHGASRRFARPAVRAGPGSGPRSAATRSTSISIRAAVPRRRRSCSPRPSSTRSSSATATALTRSWRACSAAW